MELSVIIPVYRSEKTIRLLVEKLQNELKNIVFEIVLVNDGSPDNVEKICEDLAKEFKSIKFISLRRNFGEFNAIMAGLNFADGEYSVMIDDDFQNPPSEILKLLETAKKYDFDVVYSQYSSKKHSIFRNFGSWVVNKLNDFLLEKPHDLYLSSFKLIKKEVVEEIIKYAGSTPYIDALVFQVTNNIGKVFVEHHERKEGKSSYNFKKLFSLFLTILFGFSAKPIRFCFGIGLILIFAWFLVLAISIFSQRLDYQAIMLLIFMLIVAFQFFFLGILGEYIGQMFMNQGGKPQFVIKKTILNDDRK
jgi:glycosyltransferase involved in cell wall biosynthesis